MTKPGMNMPCSICEDPMKNTLLILAYVLAMSCGTAALLSYLTPPVSLLNSLGWVGGLAASIGLQSWSIFWWVVRQDKKKALAYAASKKKEAPKTRVAEPKAEPQCLYEPNELSAAHQEIDEY